MKTTNKHKFIFPHSEYLKSFGSIKSSDLSLFDQTFKTQYLGEDEYLDSDPTNSFVSLQIVPNRDHEDDQEHTPLLWEDRIEKYIVASRKFKYNIPLMGCFEELTDSGSTRTLHLCSFPFDPRVKSQTQHHLGILKDVFLKRDVMTLEKYLESNYSLVKDYKEVTEILYYIARSLLELHMMVKITHNSIIPRNVVISKLNRTSLLCLPSFGLDDVVSALNDDHLNYFSPQVLERFERGESVFSTANDVFMFGAMIFRILLGEEFDAKYLDCNKWNEEVNELKTKILSKLNTKPDLKPNFESLVDIATKCIELEDEKRPTFAGIVQILEKARIFTEITIPPSNSLISTNNTTSRRVRVFTNTKLIRDLESVSLNDSINSIESNTIGSIGSIGSIGARETSTLPEKTCDTNVEPEDLNEEKRKQYIIDKRISEGASSVVFTLKRPSECVMKRYKKGHESDYKRELTCLKNPHHNIVSLVDNYSFKEGDSFNHVIIMEYCGFGDLYRLVSSSVQKSAIKPIKFLTLSIQLFEALCHLHTNQYVHCDVKPQNVFLKRDGTVKLGDFAFTVKNGETSPGLTFHYAPPELHEGHPAVVLCDVYSAACSLFEVLVKKKVSLKNKDFAQVWDEHNVDSRYYSRRMYNSHAIRLFQLMNECLKTDFKDRCSSREALDTLVDIQQNYSATQIQKVFRGFLVRRKFKH